MRSLAIPGFLALLLLVLAIPLGAQDVTGSWTLTYTMTGPRGGPGLERSMELTLQQEGTTVTGTATMQAFRRRAAGGGEQPQTQEYPIQEGTIEEDQITFTVSRGTEQRSFTMLFSGSVSGTTMEGTLTLSGGMRSVDPVPFKGVKKEG